MSALRALRRCSRAAGAAEFALVLPVTLLFLFGIVDAGRYGWEINKAEKATQAGARWAVATDAIPSELYGYSFAVSCGVPQGTVVDSSQFGGAHCDSDSTTATCTVTTTCSGLGNTADDAAFAALTDRMSAVYPAIGRENVVVDYNWSGLGFAGDPNGPDVAPVVTVSLRDVGFRPLTLFLFNADLPMPSFSYSLTMEDGDGNFAN